MRKLENRIGARLGGVGTPLWSGEIEAIPPIDFSDIKSLSAEDRDSLSKQVTKQTEVICKEIDKQAAAVRQAKRFSKVCGVLSFLAASLISVFSADIRAWLILLFSRFGG